jgi:hypothetical protein
MLVQTSDILKAVSFALDLFSFHTPQNDTQVVIHTIYFNRDGYLEICGGAQQRRSRVDP